MRKLLQILCCIGLCALPLEMIPASVSAETVGDGAEFIENVELLRGDSALNNGDSVAAADELVLRYTLKPLDESMNLPGSEWDIAIPEYLENNHPALNQEIKIGGQTIARITAGARKDQIKLTFEQELGELPIYEMKFEFGARLAMDEIDGRQEAAIGLVADHTVRLKITDNAIKDPAVTGKSGVYEKTGTIAWTVSLSKQIAPFDEDQNALQYTTGFLFCDELTDKQTYVENSLTLKVGDRETHPAVQVDGQTLRVTLDQPLSQEGFITYRTMPSSAVFVGDDGQLADPSQGMKVTNTAQLWQPDGSTKLSEAQGEVLVKGESWLMKTGESYDLVNKTMTWKLVVHTQSLPLESITIYDELEDRLRFNPADANVTVNGTSVPAGVTLNPAFDGRSGGDQKLLTIDHPQEAEYVITYLTHFDLDLTAQNVNTNLKNKAWLEINWDPDGAGPEPVRPYGTPVIEKNHKLPTSVVEKSANYNAATRRITWTVTLNKNLLDVKNGTITDTLTTTNQKYIGNPEVITPKTGYTITIQPLTDKTTAATQAYEVLIANDAGETNTFNEMIVFQYETEATDPLFYADNAKMKFDNKVAFGSDAIPTLTASAQPQFSSTVLQKSAEGYDYQTHEIRWKIVVNQNGTELTDVRVKDALPEYLWYVENSLTVRYASQNKDVPMTPVIEKNELQIELGTLHEQVTLTFRTKLDANAKNLPEGFRFDQSNTSSDANALLALTNTAVLEKQEGQPVSHTAKLEIANTAFDKSSVVHSDQYTVDYTIKINQAGADLSAICPDGLVITDTMSEELLLDPESVVLKQTEIQTNGDFKETNTIEGTAVQVNGNQAVFTLPSTLDLHGSYVLRYSAFVNVASKGEFALSNQASMGNQSSGLANNDAIQFQSKYSAGSATRIPGRASLELTKTAIDDDTPVAGAEYGLYAKNTAGEQYLMQKAVTDSAGKVMFTALKIKAGENEYTVKELSAPQGFVLDDAEYPVTMTAKAGTIQTMKVSDARLRGEVAFLKQDQYGKPVSGALFAIYKNDAGIMDETTQLSQAASDDQGQVHFMDLDLDQTYVIAELSAPQGYDKTEELYEVTVDADGVSSTLREQRSGQEMHAVVNKKHPAPPAPDPSEPENSTPSAPAAVLPYTGDREFVLALAGGFVLIAAGLALTLKKRRHS